MELVLEICNGQGLSDVARKHSFGEAGGRLGRGSACDWVIPDPRKHLSGQHATVSFRGGAFYLTDTSRNGTFTSAGARLPRHQPFRIAHGSVYNLCDYEIRALVIRSAASSGPAVGRPAPTGSTIPDDAFIELDPLKAFERGASAYVSLAPLGELGSVASSVTTPGDFAPVYTESLVLPELVPPAAAPAASAPPRGPGLLTTPHFWQRFGQALGLDLAGLDDEAREALAIHAAGLLAQAAAGLRQNLLTLAELKRELKLDEGLTSPDPDDPLRGAGSTCGALQALLAEPPAGQQAARQAIAGAFQELQAHQVAMLAGSRAALRAGVEHFSPDRLQQRVTASKRRFAPVTDGSRWRAFGRYYQVLQKEGRFFDHVLAPDFAHAYREQTRLIAALNADHSG